jgi:penicillin-binding protein 2
VTAPLKNPETTRLRLAIVGVVVVSLFAALFARLWYLQVMDSRTLAAKVVHNATRTLAEPAPRGRILDRGGRVLVDNRYSFVVTLSRTGAQRNPDVVGRLAALFAVPLDDLWKKVQNPRFSPYRPIPLFEDVPVEKLVYIKEHSEDFPPDEVRADRQVERTYPNGTLAAHMLGYVGEINDDELKTRRDKGYAPGDEIGKSGVEQTYENFLRGRPGRTVLEVDPRGTVLRTLEHQDPVQGDDVQLTVDLDVQKLAEDSLAQGLRLTAHSVERNGAKVLDPAGGAVTVLDPHDGSVLAMASYPTYDPTIFVNGIKPDVFAALQDPQSRYPLNDRAIAGQYAPGSTFKLATATAALSRNLITPATTFPDDNGVYTIPHCTGRCTFRNARGASYGRVPMTRAVTLSSDVFFYNLGALFWQQRARFGETAIQDAAHQLGLGLRTGVALPGEAVGRVSDPEARKRAHDRNPRAYPEANWFVGDNVNLAIGQGETVVTPLQLATAYGAFGNGGTVWQPRVAAHVLDRSGNQVVQIPPHVNGHVDLPAIVRFPILDGMKGVVADPSGTAFGAFAGFPLDVFPVAGKTGTSQVNGKQDNALFVSFAPADNPRYAISVVMEESGFGGTAAAPVARRIYDGILGKPVGPIQLGSGQD